MNQANAMTIHKINSGVLNAADVAMIDSGKLVDLQCMAETAGAKEAARVIGLVLSRVSLPVMLVEELPVEEIELPTEQELQWLDEQAAMMELQYGRNACHDAKKQVRFHLFIDGQDEPQAWEGYNVTEFAKACMNYAGQSIGFSVEFRYV